MAPEYYVFTGRERVPRHVTHVLIDRALKFVRARAFEYHRNIEEVICHDGVVKIEELAFHECPSLRRVIMRGVKVLEKEAFQCCVALTSIECGKLEIIRYHAFCQCESLNSIDLPSIKILGKYAFDTCLKLINVKFGKELESIGRGTFVNCHSLECVALPLTDVNMTDNIFLYCEKLNHIDLVGGVHETVAALLLEEWRNDMNEEIDAINQILLNTPADWFDEPGGKTQAIRTWIGSVLRKFVHYKGQHRRYLNEAIAALQPALPNDILFKNVLPFVELPSDTCLERED